MLHEVWPDRFKLVFGSSTDTESDNFAYQNGSDVIINGEGELQVYDVLGRMVETMHVNGVATWRASSAQTGVYILRLIGNETKTQKIVVR